MPLFLQRLFNSALLFMLHSMDTGSMQSIMKAILLSMMALLMLGSAHASTDAFHVSQGSMLEQPASSDDLAPAHHFAEEREKDNQELEDAGVVRSVSCPAFYAIQSPDEETIASKPAAHPNSKIPII